MSASPTMDRYTFQYAELKRGTAPALAVATIALEFIHGFSDKPHYEELLSSLVETLAAKEDAHVEEAWRNLSQSLAERQHALLEEERKKERRPKKWVPSGAVHKDLNEESSDDDAGAELTPEEIKRRQEEEEEKQKAKEAEWQHIQERMEALERQKAENEAKLAARARQVDAKAFEEKLKQEGVVLLNAGETKGKKGGKGGKEQSLSAGEVGELHREVAEVMREKESLKSVLATSDEELPERIAEAKKALEAVTAEANAAGTLENKKAKEMAKGQITQLQQKLSKQTMERNRLALQLKAREPNPQRDELVELLRKADKLAAALELSQ